MPRHDTIGYSAAPPAFTTSPKGRRITDTEGDNGERRGRVRDISGREPRMSAATAACASLAVLEPRHRPRGLRRRVQSCEGVVVSGARRDPDAGVSTVTEQRIELGGGTGEAMAQ
jgi:hypothetical protein